MNAYEKMKPIAGKRILICGKGGSGKSTIVVLMADVLQKEGYDTLVIDGNVVSIPVAPHLVQKKFYF